MPGMNYFPCVMNWRFVYDLQSCIATYSRVIAKLWDVDVFSSTQFSQYLLDAVIENLNYAGNTPFLWSKSGW